MKLLVLWLHAYRVLLTMTAFIGVVRLLYGWWAGVPHPFTLASWRDTDSGVSLPEQRPPLLTLLVLIIVSLLTYPFYLTFLFPVYTFSLAKLFFKFSLAFVTNAPWAYHLPSLVKQDEPSFFPSCSLRGGLRTLCLSLPIMWAGASFTSLLLTLVRKNQTRGLAVFWAWTVNLLAVVLFHFPVWYGLFIWAWYVNLMQGLLYVPWNRKSCLIWPRLFLIVTAEVSCKLLRHRHEAYYTLLLAGPGTRVKLCNRRLTFQGDEIKWNYFELDLKILSVL